MARVGLSLNQTLAPANLYARYRSTYNDPAGGMSQAYPSIPNVNVTNIALGYDAQKNGTTCTPPGGGASW